MLWMDTAEGSFLTNNGGVLLADNTTFPGLKKVIEAQGYLCAELEPPGPAARGRLSLLIEEGIELALDKVGAVAPGVGASANVDASISDQLYRARLVERRGIVVMLPFLEGIGNWAGTLDGEDSVTLSWWMQATQERPLGLVIESANQSLKVYPTPVPFAALLRSTTYPPPPPTAPDQASSAEAMELSEPPPQVSISSPEVGVSSAVAPGEPCDAPPSPSSSASLGSSQVALAPAPPLEIDAQDLMCESPRPVSARAPELADDVHEARTVKLEPTRDILEAARNGELGPAALGTPAEARDERPEARDERPEARDERCETRDERCETREGDCEAVAAPGGDLADDHDTEPTHALATHLADEPVDATGSNPEGSGEPVGSSDAEGPGAAADFGDASAAAASAAPASGDGEDPVDALATPVLTPSARLPKVTRLHKSRGDVVHDDAENADPFHRMAQREWPNWLRELDTTRGPKPLAVVERTFVSAYTPLKEAWLRNIASPKALSALRTFADSFEHSYAEAFDALRVRGKRPTMVLDIPEIAQRIGRLHGARSIQLVLVDAMRFDVGLRVQDRLRKLAKGQVSLAERLLLWSALPSTTETQLELIGKGSSGLREPIVPPETAAVVARGKNAATPRRIKAGQRELIKLDVIEAAIAEPGKAEAVRLDELADGVAEAMAEYLSKLPPRTLVMMFGDHGFLLDPVVGGTSPGRSGGATPEEVLVPAFAWLVGNVH